MVGEVQMGTVSPAPGTDSEQGGAQLVDALEVGLLFVECGEETTSRIFVPRRQRYTRSDEPAAKLPG